MEKKKKPPEKIRLLPDTYILKVPSNYKTVLVL